MYVETYDGADERAVVTAMITHSTVLARIAARWPERPFASEWANTVGEWCINYQKSKGGAPGKGIRSLFRSWARKTQDTDTVALVEKFLEGLSEEYETADEINPELVIDTAAELFTKVRLGRLKDDIERCLSMGKVKKAEAMVTSYNVIELGPGSTQRPFNDPKVLQQALDRQPEDDRLIEFGNDLDHFFKGNLTRDSFLAFVAPDKTGKSYVLMELAYQAMCQRKRVAFFEVGDMSERQLNTRLAVRAASHPYYSVNDDGTWPCTVLIPTSVRYSGKGEPAAVEWREKTFKKPLDDPGIVAAVERIKTNRTKSPNGVYFQSRIQPNSTVSAADIRAAILEWKRAEDWVPDVVVIDYADILAPMPGYKMETRDQICETWKKLRAISQEFHCLLITATQSDAGGYDKKLLDRTNFSEDKRKNSHVTGMVGINQTWPEKEREVRRLNWIVNRDNGALGRRCIHVAGCLSIGNPFVKAHLPGND